MTVKSWFAATSVGFRQIEQIQFSEGIVWDTEHIIHLVSQPTEGDDVLAGTPGDDVIDALSGNDILDGGTGSHRRGRGGRGEPLSELFSALSVPSAVNDYALVA